ncbi:MAG: hypothetical protein HYR97_09025, partial [Candidatus Melainabacteria bacterium]|nr:hypothetical protein [Candidatus Melainabacteria bacterium]
GTTFAGCGDGTFCDPDVGSCVSSSGSSSGTTSSSSGASSSSSSSGSFCAVTCEDIAGQFFLTVTPGHTALCQDAGYDPFCFFDGSLICLNTMTFDISLNPPMCGDCITCDAGNNLKEADDHVGQCSEAGFEPYCLSTALKCFNPDTFMLSTETPSCEPGCRVKCTSDNMIDVPAGFTAFCPNTIMGVTASFMAVCIGSTPGCFDASTFSFFEYSSKCSSNSSGVSFTFGFTPDDKSIATLQRTSEEIISRDFNIKLISYTVEEETKDIFLDGAFFSSSRYLNEEQIIKVQASSSGNTTPTCNGNTAECSSGLTFVCPGSGCSPGCIDGVGPACACNGMIEFNGSCELVCATCTTNSDIMCCSGQVPSCPNGYQQICLMTNSGNTPQCYREDPIDFQDITCVASSSSSGTTTSSTSSSSGVIASSSSGACTTEPFCSNSTPACCPGSIFSCPAGFNPACIAGTNPSCVKTGGQTAQGSCVECTNNTHCSSEKICNTSNNTCVDCVSSANCTSGLLCNNASNMCVECNLASDCTSGKVCNPIDNMCVECNIKSDCTSGKVCLSNSCSPCTNDNQCDSGQICDSGACENIICSTTLDCMSGSICCDSFCVTGNCCNSFDCPVMNNCISNMCIFSPCTQNSDCSALSDPTKCLDGFCNPNMTCTQLSTCAPFQVCINSTCLPSSTSSSSSGTVSSSGCMLNTIECIAQGCGSFNAINCQCTGCTPTGSSSSSGTTTVEIPQPSTTSSSSGSTETEEPIITTDEVPAIGKPIGLDPILNPDSAPISTITSLPRAYNIKSLKIKNISKIIRGLDPDTKEKAVNLLERSLTKSVFSGNIIAGGEAYIGLNLIPRMMVTAEDLKGLEITIVTLPNNTANKTTSSLESFNELTNEVLLKVRISEEILPGKAILLINITKDGKPTVLSKAGLVVLPSLILNRPISEREVGQPTIESLELTAAPIVELRRKDIEDERVIKLVIEGDNLIGSEIKANGTLLDPPIANQPFTIITFTNNDGLEIQNIRTKDKGDNKRVIVTLTYDRKRFKGTQDIRFFTLTTPAGQVTGKINLQGKIKKIDVDTDDPKEQSGGERKPESTKGEDIVLTLDNAPNNANSIILPQNNQVFDTFPSTDTTSSNITSPPPTIIYSPPPSTTIYSPPPSYPSSSIKIIQPPSPSNKVSLAPQLPVNIPPPPKIIKLTPFSSSSLARVISPPTPPTSSASTIKLEDPDIHLDDLSGIELVPSKKEKVDSKLLQDINVKSLNLKGPDQVILQPTISYFIFDNNLLKGAEIEKTTLPSFLKGNKEAPDEKKEKKIEPILSLNSKGAIRNGNGSYIINLKDGANLNPKNISNVIHVLINKNEAIFLPSKSHLLSKDKILVDLSFPDNVPIGNNLYACLLNKGGGEKEVIAKGYIEVHKSFDFKNLNSKSDDGISQGLPVVTSAEAREIRKTNDVTIYRLIVHGQNFASRLIRINDQIFKSKPYTSHTQISFADDKNIEVIRTRVLPKGNKILITLKSKRGKISDIPFTVSTPNGQFFKDNIKFHVIANENKDKKLAVPVKKDMEETKPKKEKQQ